MNTLSRWIPGNIAFGVTTISPTLIVDRITRGARGRCGGGAKSPDGQGLLALGRTGGAAERRGQVLLRGASWGCPARCTSDPWLSTAIPPVWAQGRMRMKPTKSLAPDARPWLVLTRGAEEGLRPRPAFMTVMTACGVNARVFRTAHVEEGENLPYGRASKALESLPLEGVEPRIL
jgi:hypothetical protein